ncbi:MAG TPA: hypothetical protein VK989_17165, partial [Polyangia bacterium]|nr:hypothetical protein [Polyangia bacterium]
MDLEEQRLKTIDTLARTARDVLVIVIVGVSAGGCGKTKPQDSSDAAATADATRDASNADRSPDVAVDSTTDVATESPTDVADQDGTDADQFCVRGTTGVVEAGVYTDCKGVSTCDGGVPTCACISALNPPAVPLSAICAMGCQQ